MGITYQGGANVALTYREETAGFGVLPPNDAQAKRFPLVPGDGFQAARAAITSAALRPDLQSGPTRLGSHSIDGTLAGELGIGLYDDLLAAGCRGAWAAQVTAASTFEGSVNPGAGTITRTAGSWIADGWVVGDIATTGSQFAAGAGRRGVVVNLTATVMTLLMAVPLDGFGGTVAGLTLIRERRVVMPPAGGLVRRSYTFEQVSQDVDESLVFRGNRVASWEVGFAPDQMIGCSFGFRGQTVDRRTGAQSPYFTAAPSVAPVPLNAADAFISEGGTAIGTVTSLSLSCDLNVGAIPVVGSYVTPDVSEGVARLTGSVTFVRSGLSRWNNYWTEVGTTIAVLFREPGTSRVMAMAVPLARLTRVGAPFAQESGPVLETCDFSAEVPAGAGTAPSLVVFATTAAA